MNGLTIDGPVLVTGAGGCIGAWALAKLLAGGVQTIVADLSADRRRPELLSEPAQLDALTWLTVDVSDSDAFSRVVQAHQPRAIIHLAGLQVPFCKADPVLGARVNVIGTLNVLEAARAHGIKRVAYASSVAALSDGPQSAWLKTLYGAYKHCNEESANVYWQDWEVPSVGIRPNIVYGVGRDQGMSSLPTVAMLAAVAGSAYTVPFKGPLGMLHGEDIASAFIQAVSEDREGAHVFDCNGSATTVQRVVEIIREEVPGVDIRCDGDDLPFPGDLSNEPLSDFLGGLNFYPIEEGIRETIARFRVLHQRGQIEHVAD